MLSIRGSIVKSIGLQDIKMLTKTITLCIKLVKWNTSKHDDDGDDDDDDDDINWLTFFLR